MRRIGERTGGHQRDLARSGEHRLEDEVDGVSIDGLAVGLRRLGVEFLQPVAEAGASRFSKWTGASMSALALPTIGRQAPAATGMSSRPASVSVLSTTLVTCSIGPAAPVTVVTPSSFRFGRRSGEQHGKNVVAG